MRNTIVAALGAALVWLSPTAEAATFKAVEAYYTFGSGVSSNQTRLLADKASVIGFPGLDTVSFLRFAPGDLPSETLGDKRMRALLVLEHDPDELAGTLIPASDARPVSVSAYGLGGMWDPVGGNLADIMYGTDGAAAVATTMVGDPGRYRWDITELVDSWITDASLPTALSLSGVFGNVNIDDRNSYGAFHTVSSTTGLMPTVRVAPVPLPATLLVLLSALPLLSRRGRAGLSGTVRALVPLRA
ncbi:MAG: hypothetical protein AAGH83_03845 [Pseudomonadota bacterium]